MRSCRALHFTLLVLLFAKFGRSSGLSDTLNQAQIQGARVDNQSENPKFQKNRHAPNTRRAHKFGGTNSNSREAVRMCDGIVGATSVQAFQQGFKCKHGNRNSNQ